MDRLATAETDVTPGTPQRVRSAQRAFSISMLASGIRCVLAYIVFPFVTPFLGLAPGVGPGLGIAIGLVAVAANLLSMRRFWVLNHPWRKPVTALHLGVITFLMVLIALDVAQLAGVS